MILETYRECLRDVLDLPGLTELLTALHRRELSLVEVETPTASPFASSLLFDYVATYMYEGDTPNAERRAAALSLDRDLLRELLGQEELRELIDPAALDQVEADLQHRSERTRAATRRRARRRAPARRRPDRRRGGRPRRWPGATRPGCWPSSRASAARSGCGSAARSAGSRPTTPASTATRSAPCRPAGCPRPSSADVERPARAGHGALRAHPRPVHDGRAAAPATASIRRARWPTLERDGELVRGELRPGGTRARVVRHGRPAAPAARLAGRAAQGDRGRRRRARWRRSCRAGRASTAIRPPAPGSTACARSSSRCRASRSRPRRGSVTCCRAAAAPTRPPGWTSSARAARSSGSAPGRSGATPAASPCTSARTPRRSARREPSHRRRAAGRAGPRRDPRAPRAGAVLLHRPAGRAAARARGGPGGAVGPGVGRAR